MNFLFVKDNKIIDWLKDYFHILSNDEPIQGELAVAVETTPKKNVECLSNLLVSHQMSNNLPGVSP